MTALELGAPIVWTAALHLAAWAVGHRLLKLIDTRRWAPRSVPERHFLAGVLGFIGFAQLGVLLAVLGALYAPLLAAIVVLGGLVGIRDLVRSGAFATLAALRPTRADLPLAAAVGLLVAKIPAALYPVLRHDDAAYHLALPKVYLAEHGFVLQPFSHYANMPHLVEVLYAYAFAGGGFLAAKLLSVSFAGWTLLGLAALVRPHLGRLGVGVAALLYIAAPNLQWHLGLAHVEVALGLWLLGALVALLALERSSGGSRSDAVVLGVCLGAALASKYTGWLFSIPLLVAAAFVVVRAPLALAERGRCVLLFSSIAGLSVLPWLWKNTIYTGNPIYPNAFDWFGGLNWSDAQALHLERSMAFAGGATGGVGAALALPWRLVAEPTLYFSEAFSASLLALFMGGLGFAFSTPERRARHGLVAAVALGGVLVWWLGVQQGRFLVAWLPIAVILAVSCLSPLQARPRELAMVALAISLVGVAQLVGQAPRSELPAMDVFRLSKPKLVARNQHHEVTQYLNAVVPPGGKVLGLWENRLFFLKATLHADTAWEAPQILSALRARDDAGGFAADRVAEGFTHGVITHNAQKYLDNERMFDLIDPAVYPAAQLARDRELIETLLRVHTETVFESGSATVFRFR
ncbi:MAG: hypothetical protein VX246_16940 [Myxococcota bacterium]|nr:hypothetical protein [Myxococcota bacterium]